MHKLRAEIDLGITDVQVDNRISLCYTGSWQIGKEITKCGWRAKMEALSEVPLVLKNKDLV